MQTPVLVGIAQLNQRIDDPNDGKEPYLLMLEAVRAAAEDAGSHELLSRVDSVRVIKGGWRYQDPGRAIAEVIGSPGAETCLTPFGGNFVQTTMNMSCLDVQSGKHEVIVIAGAECGNTRAKARRAGFKPQWSALEGTPDRMIGADAPMMHPREEALNIIQPIQVYPILESALRHHRGQSIDEHLRHISELWAGFSVVAAGNPHAWIREAKTAEEIRTPSTVNRPVSFPYPKFLNSNNNVDQAAALILTSTEKARALGIAEDKWVYPWVGTNAHDHYFVSNRNNLHSSPAIRFAGTRALEMAGIQPTDIDMVDLYSCFPVAVQVSAAELGLDPALPWTVTGGMTWGGGPLNDYVMHSIARMAELLREKPGERGLVTANGGYITKHAFGVYSTEPPSEPYRHEDLQDRVDQTPSRELVDEHFGTAEVEGYTVMYDGDGPAIAYLAARLDDARVWGICNDRDTASAMTTEEFCGRRVTLAGNAASF
ncbi:MAG: acetyl-CoA acetyltransferase [Pseudomonadales bacterium]|jgi:acetyl-CoA C-acetyltransferase|nr:acetyl-CoA acetyltransferase [Pseudomonadales bacterium]MDP6471619.1 acetyl-CoA acetyltransferase [Pseudomonadales bacterium]MDP6828882.1 acetyl-CoA acetyltransferase [Pseudomonadales bacterium]MDP6972806.1 acetyl-CoA acetyltransferase [Pseudomonadales bacterium]|tara:strand:+ start:1051 stop:2502 length:1452 start_codon:yes stop_codon:yes gene_type:complete